MIGSSPFASVAVYVSPLALETTTERLFPASKHRSARIRKKLIKRHGGEFRQRPVIWRTPAGFVVHPALYAELTRKLRGEARP